MNHCCRFDSLQTTILTEEIVIKAARVPEPSIKINNKNYKSILNNNLPKPVQVPNVKRKVTQNNVILNFDILSLYLVLFYYDFSFIFCNKFI